MADESPAPDGLSLDGGRIGHVEFAAARLILDAHAVTVTTESGTEPLSIALASIRSVQCREAIVTLALRGARHGDSGAEFRAATGARASTLRERILLECRRVPELTRGLRSFGVVPPGRRGAGDLSAGLFAPLLRARRAAAEAVEPSRILASFDAGALSEACARSLGAETAHAEANAPLRRALDAEYAFAAEPLFAALRTLGAAAEHVAGSPDDLDAWRDWIAQLRRVFQAADRVAMTMEPAPAVPAGASRPARTRFRG